MTRIYSCYSHVFNETRGREPLKLGILDIKADRDASWPLRTGSIKQRHATYEHQKEKELCYIYN